jgi:hypothetical protein
MREMPRVMTVLMMAWAWALRGGAMAADWPHFGGPNSDCSSPEKGINMRKLLDA